MSGGIVEVIVYIVGLCGCAYLFARMTGDLEAVVPALLWPIAAPIALVFWLAVLGTKHHDERP